MTPATGRPSKLKPQEQPSLREFEFTNKDFAQACHLFNELTGMTMVRRKSDLVYGRLIRRLRATGSPSFRAYLNGVKENSSEAEQFVNALTTNLTSFFREPHHFPILAEHALRSKPSGKLRVWCAAASTGEEPYSIAMTLARTYGSTPPPAEIVATDLDTNVLQTARKGTYDEDRVQSLDRETLQSFFLKGTGENAGRVRVNSSLRNAVSFDQLNLLSPAWPVRGTFDAIFLRNVLIYFDRAEQLKTLTRICSYLADDGLLFTGHSESLFYASGLVRPMGPTVYCKSNSMLRRSAT